ncbi:MAG: DoxX family membrane protein [Candidatus Binatus sp.]|uniref:DoxX family membrane protein n=1 Tax=Candidatus Binatus sp. TaxID=2811406 RepID=UPI002725603C|nr:DoxX family membrane protein [Candidatus Binatus sp.]MDO8433800.1 DoxX family membrane protein [Candidatus Binatus sp.]
MRIAMMIVRTLLGLIFFVFGLNGFFHFIPTPPPPPAAGQFFGALFATGYMIPLIFTCQVVGGALLLIGVAAPLALIILAPVIVNIVLFHLFLAPSGMGMAIAVALLEVILAWANRAAFAPLFGSQTAS